jgi:DNA-binding transcriptional ArsR family regulator
MASSADSPSWYRRFVEAEGAETGELCRLLADARRRALLGVLDRSDVLLTEAELARLVASDEAGVAPDEVTPAVRERIEIALHHVHLPKLEEYGLIEGADQDSITRVQHPFWADSDLRAFLTQSDVAPATATATFDLLANRQRRAVLAFLYERGKTTPERVAREISAIPSSGQETTEALMELTHRHLPKLAAADVIEVPTDDHVSYTGNLVLEQWFGEVMTRGGEGS